VRAISFSEGADKLITIQYGDSDFKIIEEFWYDFRPDGRGGMVTTAFMPNLVPDTPSNRAVVQEIADNRAAKKAQMDKYDNEMYQIRNKLVKVTGKVV